MFFGLQYLYTELFNGLFLEIVIFGIKAFHHNNIETAIVIKAARIKKALRYTDTILWNTKSEYDENICTKLFIMHKYVTNQNSYQILYKSLHSLGQLLVVY